MTRRLADKVLGLLGSRTARPSSIEFARYAQPARRWLVLDAGANPSTDYYVRPLAETSGLPVNYRHLDRDQPTGSDFADGTRVVFVRYVTDAWAKALRRARAALADVVYFMDDDLLDTSAWSDLPSRYRRRLRSRCARISDDLLPWVSQLWVSSPYLQQKYAALRPRLVAPAWPMATPNDAPVHLFYHGSEAHIAEHRWLRSIIGPVLEAHPQVRFEAIGTLDVHRLYRDLPRVTCVHPMRWENFVAFSTSHRRHIGLAPLLDSGFNRSRSHAKFFDITRCGAVGVYSKVSPYGGWVQHGQDGILVSNEPEAWVQAIGQLIRAPAERDRMLQQALRRCDPPQALVHGE